MSKKFLKRSFEKTKYRFTDKPEPVVNGDFGIYVHVPFCRTKCSFCPFYKEIYNFKECTRYVDAILSEKTEEQIVVFACNWCSYAGADFAGVSRLQYPPNVRLIRTMCSARVSEDFIWHAFKKGAPVVLVSGCHFGDCHYIDANHWTDKRVKRVHKKMEKLGIRKERLQLEWISAAEGIRFQKVMQNMEDLRKTVTPEEVRETKELLKKQKKKVPAES